MSSSSVYSIPGHMVDVSDMDKYLTHMRMCNMVAILVSRTYDKMTLSRYCSWLCFGSCSPKLGLYALSSKGHVIHISSGQLYLFSVMYQ